jgi:hypothetical protein
MNHQSMPDMHQSPGSWLLAPRVALTLPAERAPRALWVHQGRVWLTTPGLAQDVWLQAGQGHTLPAGSTWVAEAWPQARVSLLLAPPVSAPARPSSWRAGRLWQLWARLWRGPGWRSRPAAC